MIISVFEWLNTVRLKLSNRASTDTGSVERFNKVVSLSNKETTYRANDQRRELKFLGTPLSYEN